MTKQDKKSINVTYAELIGLRIVKVEYGKREAHGIGKITVTSPNGQEHTITFWGLAIEGGGAEMFLDDESIGYVG